MRELTEETFLKEVAKHEMTIVLDNGVHRHVRFAIPGTSNMHFDIVTYPGYLCYSGDMGCYVFSRIKDMFEFFRGKPEGPLRINEGYWGEKLEAIDRPDGYREYKPELLEAHVKEWLDEVQPEMDAVDFKVLCDKVQDEVLAYAQDGEHEAREALIEFEHDRHRPFQDSWECRFEAYTLRFVWCCYALAWGIRQYDAARSVVTQSVSNSTRRSEVSNEIPRRADMLRWIPAEHQISDAIADVERLGAHPELTEVVVMLGNAQRRLADWYDGGRPGAYSHVGGESDA